MTTNYIIKDAFSFTTNDFNETPKKQFIWIGMQQIQLHIHTKITIALLSESLFLNKSIFELMHVIYHRFKQHYWKTRIALFHSMQTYQLVLPQRW